MPATSSTTRYTSQPGCLRSTSSYSYNAASLIDLTVLSAFAGSGAPPVLLVDGYNICGCEEGAAAGLPLKVGTNKQYRVIRRVVHPRVFSHVSDWSYRVVSFHTFISFLILGHPARRCLGRATWRGRSGGWWRSSTTWRTTRGTGQGLTLIPFSALPDCLLVVYQCTLHTRHRRILLPGLPTAPFSAHLLHLGGITASAFT